MRYYFDAQKLANLVRSKRGRRGLRETAKEIGNVSPSTISRIENGKTPDMETFFALCHWLEVPPAELINNAEDEEKQNTPEAIEIQIRADKNLDPAISNVLASLVKVAYQDLSRKNDAERSSRATRETRVGETSSVESDRVSDVKPEYTLEQLLAGASSKNFKGEYDWGKPMGREIW